MSKDTMGIMGRNICLAGVLSSILHMGIAVAQDQPPAPSPTPTPTPTSGPSPVAREPEVRVGCQVITSQSSGPETWNPVRILVPKLSENFKMTVVDQDAKIVMALREMKKFGDYDKEPNVIYELFQVSPDNSSTSIISQGVLVGSRGDYGSIWVGLPGTKAQFARLTCNTFMM